MYSLMSPPWARMTRVMLEIAVEETHDLIRLRRSDVEVKPRRSEKSDRLAHARAAERDLAALLLLDVVAGALRHVFRAFASGGGP